LLPYPNDLWNQPELGWRRCRGGATLRGLSTTATHARYARVAQLIATDRCVILDGATGSELIDVVGTRPELDEQLWGAAAILDAPAQVQSLHRRYVDVGADIVTTDTWGLATAVRDGGVRLHDASGPVHWMDVARRGVRLARAATADTDVAVAFSINGDVDTPDGRETIRLLSRAFEADPPDLILLETLSLVRPSTYQTIEALLETGLPLWLSFRRCRHGVCGVYGEHWGGPEGDAFGRAARRFEELGASALLINCIPPDHATGMLSWLRDFTDLPLGVYPNLGYLSSAGWRHEGPAHADDFAALALAWREEGAQIVGGCCGVGPEHVAAARAALEGTRPGHRRIDAAGAASQDEALAAPAGSERWTDRGGRPLFPLPFPELAVEDGVVVPNQASLLVWKHLWRERAGEGARCLDLGCGSGIQAVQLALNGAASVDAIDIDPAAVRNTLTNAFRNGVAERVRARTADLYPWVPDGRYDVVVATLTQTPLDPFGPPVTHRPHDYWGRSLFDHMIRLLPETLAPGGVAYVLQLSLIGERRTLDSLERAGLRSRVLDFAFVDFGELGVERSEQIERVESLSDAYHLSHGGRDVMVAYLIEITRTGGEGAVNDADGQ
jgi:S-methylmethionine-dependent homocysteine/selenocysteine methylase/SAM-dependent methyltransferase